MKVRRQKYRTFYVELYVNQKNEGAAMLAMGAREWIMLITLAILWGGSFFFYKITLEGGLPPFLVVLGRVGLAAIVLNVWLFARGEYLPRSPAVWRDFFIMGVINNVIPFSLIVFGEQRISGGLASILNATTPIFTVIVAHFWTSTEKLSGYKLLGILCGFVGVVIIVGPEVISNSHGRDIPGEMACLVAAISYAFAGVFGKRFRNMKPMTVATGQITSSAILLIPIALVLEHPWALPMPAISVWEAVVGLALLSTVFAYVLYFRILSKAGATNLLLVAFLMPVSAILLDWGFLGEGITLHAIIGMAVIGLGLTAIDGRLLELARRSRRRLSCYSKLAIGKADNTYDGGDGI